MLELLNHAGQIEPYALLLFAASIAFRLGDHEKRISKTEKTCEQCRLTVTRLADREGITQ